MAEAFLASAQHTRNMSNARPVFQDIRVREAFYRWFDAEARALDFSDPATVDVINEWVEEATNGRIPNIARARSWASRSRRSCSILVTSGIATRSRPAVAILS